jgi:hypothetical protein
MALVPNVEADQQSRDLLYDAGVFQFAAIDGADSWNLCRKLSRELRGIGIIAAYNDVTIKWGISVQQICGQIVECRDHAHSLGHEFGCLLRCGPLPDA